MDIEVLRNLPKWKSLDEARKERIEVLKQRILEQHARLVSLQAEAPDNTNCGWFSFGNNESFELDRQFTITKENIARAEREILQLTQASPERRLPGRAYHGSILVARSRDGETFALRLVLTNEPTKDHEHVEHVELMSPLGSRLLGIEEGDVYIPMGTYRNIVEIEEVI